MNIIVYVKTGCPWCKDVLSFLNEKGISYEERNVLDNEDFMKEMIEKSGQKKAPTLDIDGEILSDSDKEEVEKFLTEKGIL